MTPSRKTLPPMTPLRMLLPLATIALLAGACGGTPTVDRAELEKQVSSSLAEQAGSAPDDVSCPDDLEGTKGRTVRCTVTRDSEDVPVEVRVTSVDGSKVHFQIEPTVLQSTVEDQVSASLEQQAGVAPDDISCPDDLIGRVGEKMRCTLTAGSDKLGVTVTVTDVKGQHVGFDVAVDQMDKSKGQS